MEQAAEFELGQETEKFLNCLSAFMSGFRTVHNRLCGVAENKQGVAAKENLLKILESHTDISFLIECSNIEVHEDGVVVHPRYRIHASGPLYNRWKSKFEPAQSKWVSRFNSRFDVHGVVIQEAKGWQFSGNSKNALELCRDALNAIEEYSRQAVTESGSRDFKPVSVGVLVSPVIESDQIS